MDIEERGKKDAGNIDEGTEQMRSQSEGMISEGNSKGFSTNECTEGRLYRNAIILQFERANN